MNISLSGNQFLRMSLLYHNITPSSPFEANPNTTILDWTKEPTLRTPSWKQWEVWNIKSQSLLEPPGHTYSKWLKHHSTVWSFSTHQVSQHLHPLMSLCNTWELMCIMWLFKPSQYKQVTQSSPLQQRGALMESRHQSPQDCLAEGQQQIPFCALLFSAVEAIPESCIDKEVTDRTG